MKMLLILWIPMLLSAFSVHAEEDSDDHGHSGSIMQFSYSNDDPKGPHSWDNEDVLPGSETYSLNFCALNKGVEWVTPLNIDNKSLKSPDGTFVSDPADGQNAKQKSLIFFMSDQTLDTLDWSFGHPTDSYHGLEVRPPFMGTFQITDRYEHIGNAQELDLQFHNLKYINYDFNFMSIYYCDPKKAAAKRSMHQINGQKFPLELQFIFLSEPPKIGVGKYICRPGQDISEACIIAVMVVVMGEFGEKDNPRLQPLINAAAAYEGPNFNANDMDEEYEVIVPGPWSPSWLIPDSSSYYYYDSGSLPVPPCWWVARVYVIKERIKISRKQFNVLTNIKSAREPTTAGRMPCTYSTIRQPRDEDNIDVKFYEWSYAFKGDDHRPSRGQKGQKGRQGVFSETENSGCKWDANSVTLLATVVGLTYFKIA